MKLIIGLGNPGKNIQIPGIMLVFGLGYGEETEC